jgi:hypothetical protein
MHMTTLFYEMKFNYCTFKVALSEISYNDIVTVVVFTCAKEVAFENHVMS